MNNFEKIYKEYFKKPVNYNEDWQVDLFKRIENYKEKILLFRYFKFAVSFAFCITLLVLSFQFYKNYNFKKELKNFLLSRDAIEFAYYYNIGTVVENYIGYKTDLEKIELNLKDSLYIYALINLENGKNLLKIKEIIDEVLPLYVETITNQNILI